MPSLVFVKPSAHARCRPFPRLVAQARPASPSLPGRAPVARGLLLPVLPVFVILVPAAAALLAVSLYLPQA